jgi:hypothetical protein
MTTVSSSQRTRRHCPSSSWNFDWQEPHMTTGGNSTSGAVVTAPTTSRGWSAESLRNEKSKVNACAESDRTRQVPPSFPVSRARSAPCTTTLHSVLSHDLESVLTQSSISRSWTSEGSQLGSGKPASSSFASTTGSLPASATPFNFSPRQPGNRSQAHSASSLTARARASPPLPSRHSCRSSRARVGAFGANSPSSGTPAFGRFVSNLSSTTAHHHQPAQNTNPYHYRQQYVAFRQHARRRRHAPGRRGDPNTDQDEIQTTQAPKHHPST